MCWSVRVQLQIVVQQDAGLQPLSNQHFQSIVGSAVVAVAPVLTAVLAPVLDFYSGNCSSALFLFWRSIPVLVSISVLASLFWLLDRFAWKARALIQFASPPCGSYSLGISNDVSFGRSQGRQIPALPSTPRGLYSLGFFRETLHRTDHAVVQLFYHSSMSLLCYRFISSVLCITVISLFHLAVAGISLSSQ
jgi:hypothetical protein